MMTHQAPFDAVFDGASPGFKLGWQHCLPLAALALFLAMPSPVGARSQPVPGFAATLPTPPPPRVADGSIFNVAAGYAGLAEGRRARVVGDPVTILLVEQLRSEERRVGKEC